MPSTNGVHAKLLTVILASLVGGGGVSAVAPLVAPGLYRPDPATGSELDELRDELVEIKAEHEALRELFKEFNKEGPRDVRAAQGRIEGKLDRILDEIKERGDEHDRAHQYRERRRGEP